jgi:cytochrome c-type biogenesis protein CcmE
MLNFSPGTFVTFATQIVTMKNLHIALLLLIAASIAVLLTFLKSTTTYDTIETAMGKPGKFVHVMAQLDKSYPVEYDAIKNPNYLSFTVFDTTGKKLKVVYHNAKPDNLEIADKLVLKGRYEQDHFECKDIQTKCPSKYKEEMGAAEKNIRQITGEPAHPAVKDSTNNKY